MEERADIAGVFARFEAICVCHVESDRRTDAHQAELPEECGDNDLGVELNKLFDHGRMTDIVRGFARFEAMCVCHVESDRRIDAYQIESAGKWWTKCPAN